MSIDKTRFQELLAKARANLAAASQLEAATKIQEMQQAVEKTDVIDTTLLGISNESINTEEGANQAIEILQDINSCSANNPIQNAASVMADGGKEQQGSSEDKIN